MRSVWRTKAAVICGLMAICVLTVSASRQAEARPPYMKAFLEKYEEVAKAQDVKNKVKCGVCHPGTSKKERNAYGKALEAALAEEVGGKDKIGKAGVKDAKVINEALTKVEKKKSEVEGKTFGDLLKDKQLPSKFEPPKDDK